MKKIPFTDNYDDLSTGRGYQFKFFCERCGNGFMSSFQKSTVGVAAGVMGIVGSFWEAQQEGLHQPQKRLIE